MALKFNYNPDQPHQVRAIQAVTDLFYDFSQPSAGSLTLDDSIPNLPQDESLDAEWLAENLSVVQAEHNRLNPEAPIVVTPIQTDTGIMLEGVSNDSYECPHFSVEMETGTGKTYVYFRTMLELYQKCAFRKFLLVVPSVAILEGVKKAFSTLEGHFTSLYGRTNFKLLEYDSEKLGQLRTFATSPFPLVMVMTLQSFNKASNKIYQPSDKLPGEKKPYQWLQEVRPVVILDEPQNMGSAKAKEAIRTLKPLLVLRYSATHRPEDIPNLTYRLTPVDAFRQGLVKQIEVMGVAELDNLSAEFLRLEEVTRARSKPEARVTALTLRDGQISEQVVTLKQGDDLYQKTRYEPHQGFVVTEIRVGTDDQPSFVQFSNGEKITSNDEVLGSRVEIWRAQIAKTLQTHMERQTRLKELGVKVLSLFFIDRVANYLGEDALLKRLFDEEYDRLKSQYADFASFEPEQVRAAYFAKKKQRNQEVINDEINEKADGEEAKEAFKLIMQDKEKLLTFAENPGGTPVAFIFAHSALKEGWDNPNVFQICTLNQTVSTLKKRQEIGRGLRLCVDQDGNRPEAANLNILTVIANQSYENYVRTLQGEYNEGGEEGSSLKPARATRAEAKRRDHLFNDARFRDFWATLCQKLSYTIRIDTESLIDECIQNLNEARFPEPIITVTKGRYEEVVYLLRLNAAFPGSDRIKSRAEVIVEERSSISAQQGGLGIGEAVQRVVLEVGEDLGNKTNNPHLRGFKMLKVEKKYDEWYLTFSTTPEVEISPSVVHRFRALRLKETEIPETTVAHDDLPIPDFIGRAASETDLTRSTLVRIFKGMKPEQKAMLPKNPEGWSNVFVKTISEVVADHIAEHIEFDKFDRDENADKLEELFPLVNKQPMKELVPGGDKSLYDLVQKDSGEEERFIGGSLIPDTDNLVVYFKFPTKSKVKLPRVIKNYNPDWAILRLEEGGGTLELVRETKSGKGGTYSVRFENEERKIKLARKYFAALGIDYRVVTAETSRYWEPESKVQQTLLHTDKHGQS